LLVLVLITGWTNADFLEMRTTTSASTDPWPVKILHGPPMVAGREDSDLMGQSLWLFGGGGGGVIESKVARAR